MLATWDQPEALARCGLFHSAYSNSYVNLAIFKAGQDRELVKEDCGVEAEELIYKFCGQSCNLFTAERMSGAWTETSRRAWREGLEFLYHVV